MKICFGLDIHNALGNRKIERSNRVCNYKPIKSRFT